MDLISANIYMTCSWTLHRKHVGDMLDFKGFSIINDRWVLRVYIEYVWKKYKRRRELHAGGWVCAWPYWLSGFQILIGHADWSTVFIRISWLAVDVPLVQSDALRFMNIRIYSMNFGSKTDDLIHYSSISCFW